MTPESSLGYTFTGREHDFLRWTVSLPPRRHAAVSLRWRLRKHTNVAGV